MVQGPGIDPIMAVEDGMEIARAASIVEKGTEENTAENECGEIIAERDRGGIAAETIMKRTEIVAILTVTAVVPPHLPVALLTGSGTHRKVVRTRIKKKASKYCDQMPHL